MGSTRPHVVVVGGGFGGLAAVRALKKANVDITLIDRHMYNTFQPLLYQVATATLNPGDITWFLRAVRANQDNVHFIRGDVVSMDHRDKFITLDGGAKIDYDYLVIATGVVANFFGVPGAEEFSRPLYRRSQALALRDAIFAQFEQAAINGFDDDIRFVVVGGGATGVETAGAFAEMRNLDLPVTYPELEVNRIHITLVEMGPYLLAPFDNALRDYTRNSLLKRGVDLRLHTKVKEVRSDGVVVEDENGSEFLPASIVVWASGIQVSPIVDAWNLPRGKNNRVDVDQHLRVKGLDTVFAVGDVAVDPQSLPQLAQPALQGGKHVGKVIRGELHGKKVKPFKYTDKGTMATIGRSSAIAQVTGLPHLRGYIAWVMWIVVHIMTLLGNRNRIATTVNLFSKYLLWGKSHNAIIGDTPPMVVRRANLLDKNRRS